MSTITKIVDRPVDAPKTPVYPRLVYLDISPDVIVFATGPSKVDSGSFCGVVVSTSTSDNYGHKVGHYDDNYDMSRWRDFNKAVTLYNK